MVSEVTDWLDFEWFYNSYIPSQTMPILKHFGVIIEQATGSYLGMRSGEKKADLAGRIQQGFRDLRNRDDLARYRTIRQKCETMGKPARSYGSYPVPPPTFSGSTFGGGHPASSTSSHSTTAASQAGSTNTAYRGLPLPSASRPSGSGWGAAPGGSSIYRPTTTHVLQDWRSSPMWKPIQALTTMQPLPDIGYNENQTTRREARTTFYLPQDIVDKLQTSRNNPDQAPHYSLRIFCASNDFYRPPTQPMRSSDLLIDNKSIPVEYPNNPDVQLDGNALVFKERGLRGQPGSAPPFDLGKSTRALILSPSKLQNVTVAHSGPTTGKKKEVTKRFFFQVVFAEMSTKEELLDQLMKRVPTPASESIAAAQAKKDEDIVAGSLKLTLKDPLSYMRITRPIRSKACSHLQCFDARWWLESNNVHPQFLCVQCNKRLIFEEIIVDGFFLNILNAVPEAVEDVIVEGDYEWHTEDNKYGSKKWMDAHRATAATNGNLDMANGAAKLERPSSPSFVVPPDTKGKRKAIEVLSSDDDDGPSNGVTNGHGSSRYHTHSSTRPSSTMRTSSTSVSMAPTNTGVIDLTLSSDEEEVSSDEGDDEPFFGQLPSFRQPSAVTNSHDTEDSSPQSPAKTGGTSEVNDDARLDIDQTDDTTTPALDTRASLPGRPAMTAFEVQAKRAGLPERPLPSSTITGTLISPRRAGPPPHSPDKRPPSLTYRTDTYNPRQREDSNPSRQNALPPRPNTGGASGTALTGGGHWSPASSTSSWPPIRQSDKSPQQAQPASFLQRRSGPNLQLSSTPFSSRGQESNELMSAFDSTVNRTSGQRRISGPFRSTTSTPDSSPPSTSLSLRANLHDTTQDLRPSALIPNYSSGSLWTGERATTTLDAGRTVKTGAFGAYTGAGGLAKSTGAESTDIFAQPASTSMRPPVWSSASTNKNQFAGTQAFGVHSASRSASYQGSAATKTITNERGEGDAI